MKPTVIDPKTTTRAEAYALWISAPNPMVTFFKTLDVTPLVRFSRKRGYKFNILLCRCIGKAADEIKEFYTLPVGRELLQYDSIAVNTILNRAIGKATAAASWSRSPFGYARAASGRSSTAASAAAHSAPTAQQRTTTR